MRRLSPILLLATSAILLISGLGMRAAMPTGASPTSTLPPRPTVSPPATPTAGFERGADQLSVLLSSNRPEAGVGEQVTLTITVGNHGRLPVHSTELRLPVSAGLDLLRVESSQGEALINPGSQTIKLPLNGLQPGKELAVRVIARVNSSAAGRSSLYSIAKAVSRDEAGKIRVKYSNPLILRIASPIG